MPDPESASVRPARSRCIAGCALAALAAAGCSTTSHERKVGKPETHVQTFDAVGQPTSGAVLADQIWGTGAVESPPVDWDRLDPSWLASHGGARATSGADVQDPPGAAAPGTEPSAPATQDPPAGEAATVPQDPVTAQQQDEQRRNAARLRIAFGDSILINDDGSVTKQYFLSQDSGSVFLNLLAPLQAPRDPKAPAVPPAGSRFGAGQQDSVLGRMLGPSHEVELVYIPDFEQFSNMGLRANEKTAAKPTEQAKNSLLLVTARPDALTAFERALNLFYANIPQVEIEVKVVEYTTSDALAIGVTQVDSNTPILQNLESGRLIQQITSNFPLTSFAGGTSINDQGLITLGGIHSSWELNAALQLLEQNNIADIQSKPRMVVRNGGSATVSTVTAQPFPKAKITNQTVTSTDIEFRNVGIVMDIRPEIAGTETVVLNIYVSVSAVTGYAATDPVPTPIVSTREAATSVHLKVGESTVIGGLVSDTQVDLEAKIPILGDIPILGYLFRSSATQRQKTNLEFYITPRILIGPRGSRGSLGNS